VSESNTLSPIEVAHSTHETNSSRAEISYTPPSQRAIELFNRYAKDSDDKIVIETEELEQLCSDANIAFDGALPLILLWQMGSKEMGRSRRRSG
jgi:DCN1-like protein 4/5